MTRYVRQRLFQPIGDEGQGKLSKSHVLIVGVGALGGANADMLVRAGIGHVTLIDRDYVELSNLQRQSLFTEDDVTRHVPKAIAAKQRLLAVNSEVTIEAIVAEFSVHNGRDLVQKADIIVDGTDNFETRFLINELASYYQKPWVYGGCVGSYGVTFPIIPEKTPCLQCLINQVPLGGETCDTVGVISPAVQLVAAYETSAVLKWLTEQKMNQELVSFDLWKGEHAKIRLDAFHNEQCPVCGAERQYSYLNGKNVTKATVLCGRNTVQVRSPLDHKNVFNIIKDNVLSARITMRSNDYLLMFYDGPYRIVVFKDGRTLIHGTNDTLKAKATYQKWLG